MRSIAACVVGCVAVGIAGLSRECPREVCAPQQSVAVGVRAVGLSIPFVENVGQAPDAVRFTAQTFAGSVAVTAAGDLVYTLPGGRRDDRRAAVTLRERIAGAAVPEVTGSERAPTRVSVFRGRDPARWRSGVPSWASVSVARPGTGVDLEVRASARNVEKVFRLDAGADPAALRVEVAGAETLSVGPGGELEVATAAGVLTFTAPVAYQETDGVRAPVDVAYAVDGMRYGFRVGRRDPSLPLVIDPLIASTYFGGPDEDWGEDIDVYWKTGEVYVTGATTDTGPEESPIGQHDAFVLRMTPDLTTLEAISFFGGSGDDLGLGLTVEERGVWVVGETTSTDLPVTPDVYGPGHHGGRTDGFIARFTNDLEYLDACTYHGGSGEDRVVAAEAVGGLRIAGETSSTDLWRDEGAIQRDFGGAYDLFFATPDEGLTHVTFQTYFGGSSSESVTRLIAGEGVVVAVGQTFSPDFPTTGNAYSRTRHGDQDGFVVHIYDDYSRLMGSTYLGGTAEVSEDEGAMGVAWGQHGDVYVCGHTNAADFPTTPGAYRTAISGPFDAAEAYVVHLSEDLSTLLASTFLGGGSADRAFDLVADRDGVYVAGDTDSEDFPALTSTIDTTFNGGSDAFVARFTPDLADLAGSAFLGGPSFERARAICTFGGVLYVTGESWGPGFPTTPGVYREEHDGAELVRDGFVTALTLESAPPEIDSFILPRTVKVVRRKMVEQSYLRAEGVFDSGSGAVDLSGPATLTVGSQDFAIPGLTPNRKGVYRYRAGGLDMRIRPSKWGSSRGRFDLKLTGAAAVAIDPDAALEVRFRSGDIDGSGIVKLTKGAYRLGHTRGDLIAPDVFPHICRATVKGDLRDSFWVRMGLASAGTTPDQAPDFTFRLGDGFERTVPSDAFVRKGDRYVYRGAKGGFTSVILDYGRERIIAVTKGVEVGEYQPGSQSVALAVKVGDLPERVVRVRMACLSTKLRY